MTENEPMSIDQEAYRCYVDACREVSAEPKTFLEWSTGWHPKTSEQKGRLSKVKVIRPQININVPNMPQGRRWVVALLAAASALIYTIFFRTGADVSAGWNFLLILFFGGLTLLSGVFLLKETIYTNAWSEKNRYGQHYEYGWMALFALSTIGFSFIGGIVNNSWIAGDKYVDPIVALGEESGCVYRSSRTFEVPSGTKARVNFWRSLQDGAEEITVYVADVEYPTRTATLVSTSFGGPFMEPEGFFADACNDGARS